MRNMTSMETAAVAGGCPCGCDKESAQKSVNRALDVAFASEDMVGVMLSDLMDFDTIVALNAADLTDLVTD